MLYQKESVPITTHAIQHLVPIIINEHCRLNSWCESLSMHAQPHLSAECFKQCFFQPSGCINPPGAFALGFWMDFNSNSKTTKAPFIILVNFERGHRGLYSEPKGTIWIWWTDGTAWKSKSIQISSHSWRPSHFKRKVVLLTIGCLGLMLK